MIKTYYTKPKWAIESPFKKFKSNDFSKKIFK
jgi:hypothetical protein